MRWTVLVLVSGLMVACKSEEPPPASAPIDAPAKKKSVVAPKPEGSTGDRVERFWQGLPTTKNACPEVFDYFPEGGVLSFWCHAKNLVSLDDLKTLGGGQIFVSGPHGATLDLNNEKTFGHYNPKFVKAFIDVAIPAAGNPSFKSATQAIYDEKVAPLARIYLRALITLKSNPQLFSMMRASYEMMEKGLPMTKPHWAFAEIAPEGMWNRFGPAAAFWVRRDLDGTRMDFERGLQLLMKTYDLDVYRSMSTKKLPLLPEQLAKLKPTKIEAEGDGPADTAASSAFGPTTADTRNRSLAGLVDEAWKSINKVAVDKACHQFEYDPGGARVVYCSVAGTVNYRQLAEKLPFPIFLSGPHTKTGLMLDSEKSFGHYNPKFVKWLATDGIPGLKRRSFVIVTQKAYDKKVQAPARAFLFARRFVEADPKLKERLQGELKHYMKNGGTAPRQSYWELFPDIYPFESVAIAGAAVAFWNRRTIDGTAKDFEKALRAAVEAYDPKFLKDLDATEDKDLRGQMEKLMGFERPDFVDGP